MRRPLSGAVVVVAAAALTLPGAAFAHAQLLRSTPADRAVVATAPSEARFVFDDSVTIASGIRAVRNGDGSVLAGKPRIVAGRTLVVPLRRNLGDGDFTLLWRVVSDDGHTISGVIAFAVGAGRPPPTPSLTAANRPGVRDVVARFLFLAGILITGGGALFRLVVGVGRERVLAAGFLPAFLGGTGLLSHASLSSRFGLAVAVATVVAALGTTAAVISTVEARATGVAWALGLLLLPAPSFAGHALDPGRPRIEVLVDVLHVVAAATWIGGLVQLPFVLRGNPESGRRFSLLALGAVVALGATGIARALAELASVSQVWSTGYGRLLIVKTGLLALLVSLGWNNRYRLLPQGAFGALARTVRVELLVLAGLVVVVALLTDTRPGRDRGALAALPPEPPALPARDAFVAAGEDGDRAVALAVEARRVRVTVLGPQGGGVDGLDVRVAGRPTAACGPGCYEADVAAAPVGRVDVAIGSRRLVLPLPSRWPPRPAGGLVARMTRLFERLRSVSYVERLASSPRNRIVSDFTLEAPNRFSYRIHGGPSAFVIGNRRWDRVPGGAWDQTSYSAVSEPTPIWEGPISNAYVLSRSPRKTTITFLNRRVPAWFTVRLNGRTLLPSELTMTASAHFMHHRYFAFDAPRKVFPPASR